MSIRMNDRLASIKPSATLAVMQRAHELREQGKSVINFAAGEPDFGTPLSISGTGITAIREGMTKYTPVAGMLQLRKAIAERIFNDYALRFTPEEIVVSNGAKQSIYNLLATVINPGDGVIIFAPYWVSYPDMVRLCDGQPLFVSCPHENNFQPDVEALRKVAAQAQGIIVCNPSNPTGAVMSAQTLEAIGAIAQEHGLWVIADEIYDKLIYHAHQHHTFLSVNPQLRETTALVNGVSKAYAMTGWRIGYCAAPRTWAAACVTLQGQTTSGPCTISQHAAWKALADDQSCVEEMRVAFQRRSTLISTLLNEITGISCLKPQGAFYAFPRISNVLPGTMSDVEWATQLLEQQHVAVVPGTEFGAPGYVRLSFACGEDQIRRGVERIATFINSYR